MKKYFIYISVVVFVVLFSSCEDTINVELPVSEPVVVIDAWINDKPEPQVIRVMKTIPYFENTFLPGLNEATVTVKDLNDQSVYEFEKSEDDGVYVWNPSVEKPVFGVIGHEYKLLVDMGSTIYEANSFKNRVPEIDSINFRFEEGNSFFPDSYFAGVYATDPVGAGDAYWIKAWKNGEFLNKPSEINISFDAGGSPGAIVDGIPFILPIRDGINPFDQDEDNNFLSPYSPGDSVYVELHAINNDAYTFLFEVSVQTDRPGGFAELFAQPLANVPSNIRMASDSPNETRVIGFFNVSSVSKVGRRLDPDNLPTKEN